MPIHYLDTCDTITADQLRGGFFEGWPTPPQPDAHLRILQGSYAVVLVLDDTTNEVIGFITAISDGVSAAYIPHLEVLSSYRGQGIGGELTQRMLERLRHLYMVDLVCDPDVQPFYARLGMHPYSAMVHRNYDRQGCEE